jgi:hypothetical protein
MNITGEWGASYSAPEEVLKNPRKVARSMDTDIQENLASMYFADTVRDTLLKLHIWKKVETEGERQGWMLYSDGWADEG